MRRRPTPTMWFCRGPTWPPRGRSSATRPAEVQLVAIGSPHASLDECRALADALAGRALHPEVAVIVTAGNAVISVAQREGLRARLEASGVVILTDLCWCTICEPVFPTPAA